MVFRVWTAKSLQSTSFQAWILPMTAFFVSRELEIMIGKKKKHIR